MFFYGFIRFDKIEIFYFFNPSNSTILIFLDQLLIHLHMPLPNGIDIMHNDQPVYFEIYSL